MAQATVIKAELRNETGTPAVRRLRRQGILPAVVCIKDGGSVTIQLNQHDFDQMLHHHAGDTMIADLEVAGQPSRKVLLVEVQRNGVSGRTEHADFHEVSMDEKMQVPVPLELVGEPVGINLGGVLEHLLREVEIEVLPGDMIEQIEVDVSGLKIGDTLLVSDIPTDPKWKILTDQDIAVAAVALPRTAEEAEATPDGEAAVAEPEVIGQKKKEEDE